ncbi:MAG: DUF4252 domain-containing protein [Bacteroidales bacterium]|nr:DUF4252 domain-containing protein [Bacteroidales bacterium]
MKKIIIGFCFILGIINVSNAQNSPADKLFDKYSGKEGFTSVYISKYMFDMITNLETGDPQNDEMKNVIGKLTGIKILATDENSENKVKVNFYEEMMKNFPKDTYKELMVIKEKDQDVKFYVKEEKGKVAELLLIVGGITENVMISIQGDIDMKNISKLAKAMNIEGMEQLEKMEK